MIYNINTWAADKKNHLDEVQLKSLRARVKSQ
jgi:hypothetical protein